MDDRIARINRRIDLHVKNGVKPPPIEIHSFDFSKQWPKNERDDESRKMLKGDPKREYRPPAQMVKLARKIGKERKQMGYLMALELLFRLGAALEEVTWTSE